MVAYNFKPDFSSAIKAGMKCQTVRKTARCKPGDKLQLYTGLRTKSCVKIIDAICESVTPIIVDWCTMTLNGHTYDRADQFAQLDGFKEYTDMAEFFDKQYGCLPFEGFVIKWKLQASARED